jgi:glycosyltransferase involved in cell wall biosynthesis
MEAWLPRCLDSICIESVIDNVEVIIVNDGSTDASLSIAESYKGRFPKSIIVVNKPNGHYGSCVNTGLKIASGKYFRILDSDDCFDSDSFVDFIAYLRQSDADLVFTNYSRDYASGYRSVMLKNRDLPIERKEYKLNGCFAINKLEKMFVLPCMTYQTSVLRKSGYKQLEGISHTDSEYCFYPLVAVKSFAFFNIVLYRYTIGREGQSVGAELVYKNRGQIYRIIQRIIVFLNENETTLDTDVRLLQSRILAHNVLKHYYIIILTHNKNEEDEKRLQEIDSALKRINNEAYNSLDAVSYLKILKPVAAWRKKSIYARDSWIFKMLIFVQKIYIKLKYTR